MTKLEGPGNEGKAPKAFYKETSRDRMNDKAEFIHANARKLLAENRFKMSDFVSLYGKEAVAKDIVRVQSFIRSNDEQLKRLSPTDAERHERAKKIGTICEAAIFRGIKDKNLLGRNAYAQATSQHDDWVNGIDLAVQFKKPNQGSSYLGLAVDVTFASDLTTKFERIKKEIGEGNLARIKYFQSIDDNFRGEVKVARVVVGVDANRMQQIIAKWDGENGDPFDSKEFKGTLLAETEEQLLTFKKYAKSVGQEQLSEFYANDLAVIQEAIKDGGLSADVAKGYDDNVYRSIKENLRNFK